MNISKTVFSIKSIDEGKGALRFHMEVVVSRKLLVRLGRIGATLILMLLAALNMPQAAVLLSKIAG